MKFKEISFDVWAETGFAGCVHTDTLTIEVDINATDKEIEKLIREETKDWLFNRIEYGYEIRTITAQEGGTK